ncbi:MAG: SRPBCC domain-containing protein [Phycisphaerales bacterium]|nr:SRPBCC domain-containing protein [Phycisphaerales bacterium]
MIKQEDDGLWIVLKETIAVHHDELFDCFRMAGGLTRWFPVAADVDPRPGGMLVLGWDKNFERKTTVAILDYDPGGMMTWDWYPGVGDTHAPIYWLIEPSVEDGSKVTMRQGPYKDDRDSLIVMASESSSWCWSLCNLRSVMEVSHDMRRIRPL